MDGQITQAGSGSGGPGTAAGSRAMPRFAPMASPAPIRQSRTKAPVSRPVPAR